MAKVHTPANEVVEVTRRWFPWPNFARTEVLEENGVPPKVARFLGKSHGGDWLVLAVIVLTMFILSSLSPLIGLILLDLALVALIFWFFGMAWQIEVYYRGRRIDQEACDGFTATKQRILKIAALYESAALKPPKAPPVRPRALEVPELRRSRAKADVTSHPMIAPEEFVLPALTEEPEEPLREEVFTMTHEPVFTPEEAVPPFELPPEPQEEVEPESQEEAEDGNAFMVDAGPVFPTKPQVELKSEPAPNSESVLQKAVRKVRAEEEALKAAGLMENKVDEAVIARATAGKKRRFTKR